MQICEFYRKESLKEFQFFEGRWRWKIRNEKIVEDSYWVTFEWIDLFGKAETIVFTSPQPHRYIHELIPLNRQFGLLRVSVGAADGSFAVVKFDWERKEFHIGDENFDEHQEFIGWDAFPDRNCSFITDGDFNFMFYNLLIDLYQHCRMDTTNCRIILNGSRFTLPSSNFNNVDLRGDIASGFSESLDVINRYNIKTRQFLNKIKISGLPSTVRFLWNDCHQRDDDNSRNQFFLSSAETETKNDQKCEYFQLHCINLETGQATTLSHHFKYEIIHVIQNLEDGFLYVQCREFEEDNYNPTPVEFYFYRIPLNEPESLFFTAFKNVPKPLPEFVVKLAMQRRDLPLNVYKRE